MRAAKPRRAFSRQAHSGSTKHAAQEELRGTAERDDRPKPRNSDVNQITRYEYYANGLLSAMTVVDPAADGNEPGQNPDQQDDNQTTRYVYAGQLDAGHTGTPVPRSDLLRAEILPDSSLTVQNVLDILNEAQGAPASHDFIEYTYHADGTVATRTDQRGVVHTYTYDAWGRLTLDHVTDLGDAAENVDGTVRAIATAYTEDGQVDTITSLGYDGNNEPTVELNEIAYDYDDWGNVSKSWQEHDDKVDRDGQGGDDSLHVAYSWDDLLRLAQLTYPNGREVHYGYGLANSMDDRLSRVATIGDGVSATYASYTYLGAGTLIGSARPDLTDDLILSYGDSTNGYKGFDRFGRVVDKLWTLDDGQLSEVDHFAYGYDRASNRLWRENVVSGNLGTPVDLDELYAHDALMRLVDTKRGDLQFNNPNPGDVQITDQVFAQDWDLDGTGNWSEFDDNGSNQERTVLQTSRIVDFFTIFPNWAER